jgi:hypothetical protein
MNKRVVFSMITSLALVVGVGATVLLVNQGNQDVRSKAAVEVELKTKSLKNTLKSPYIRLVPRGVVAKKETVVPIDILMQANGLTLSEVSLGLEFDPSRVLINKDSVQGSDVMPVVNMVSESPGKIYFSVFSSQNTSDPNFFLTEVVVATVYARIIGEAGVATISLVESGDEKTVLYGERDNATGDFLEYKPSLGEAEMIISSQ